jgi:hypothetical protein
LWYTLEVNASIPAPEQKLQISSEVANFLFNAFLFHSKVRKAVSVEIVIHNPLDEAIEFEVTFEGEGLFGEPSITLGPKETSKYELLFYPHSISEQVCII